MAITPESFVSALAIYCRDGAVADCVTAYEAPSGRRPSTRTLQMSAWFKALQPGDRQMVIAAMADAAHGTLFSVLCTLDGARTIDDQKHTFVVMSELDGVRDSISSPAIDLHDLLDQPGALGA